MWRIQLPFVKVDRIHDSPCKIGVVQGRADKEGGENELTKETQPVDHLPVRGDQKVGTAQGKT